MYYKKLFKGQNFKLFSEKAKNEKWRSKKYSIDLLKIKSNPSVQNAFSLNKTKTIKEIIINNQKLNFK